MTANAFSLEYLGVHVVTFSLLLLIMADISSDI